MQSMTEVDRVDSVQENPARESYLRPDHIEDVKKSYTSHVSVKSK